MYFKIATFLFILNMIFFLRPVILSLVLYKKLTVLGTLKRLFNFLIMIPIEILRIVFLRQIKYYVDPNEERIFNEIYSNQLIYVGFGNKKLGIFFNIMSQILMIFFFVYGLFNF